ncbi:alpha/beta fold hydrolase [Paraburkholderia sp. DHOC27]|uniref:thioesterase domain-containing protein n=1 Tax=Paraburkholderia sp. DHOC27 TaxID=2303330 RepID=UPI000E3DB681|nr:alpha/beta fold hydrolase [Paraburkholderia sp. DHOC27]RFU47500.1 alpha/beta fold hydrolase [Paraburkholderia sp. DHOC27]
MPTSPRTLVPMRAGTGKPLFFVPGISATVDDCRALIHAMRSPRPVFGIEARGLDGQQPPLDRIEAIATDYLQQIRSIQPRGPYAVAGYSLGGLVALEIAQQLRHGGEQMEWLCLLDCYAHDRWLPLGPWLQSRGRFAARHWRKLRAVPLARLPAYVKQKSMGAVNRVRERLGHVARQPGDDTHQPVSLLQQVQDELWIAMVRYRPRPWHGGPIVYVRAAVMPAELSNPMPLWHRIARGGLIYTELDCSHVEMLRTPFAERVAALLDDGLAQIPRSTEDDAPDEQLRGAT